MIIFYPHLSLIKHAFIPSKSSYNQYLNKISMLDNLEIKYF